MSSRWVFSLSIMQFAVTKPGTSVVMLLLSPCNKRDLIRPVVQTLKTRPILVLEVAGDTETNPNPYRTD